MKIPSSFSNLMRAVVAPKMGFVRNLNPSIEGRLMHTSECRLLGLHMGTKNVAGCVYHPAPRIIVPLWPPFYKDDGDIFSIAKQLKEKIDKLGVCKVVVGRWPWSMKEEQSEHDLILGAAKVECFMDELLNTGVLKRKIEELKHLYYDVRVVLNESGIK
ncbi:hypothetical protein LWI29_011255 [Acer saccharum]|uniref:Uncharacterized protein n=1 Tax=Acer saccharum TaxID=4024 RepID=A0AA39RHU0_ACESA|nr:hypothetical protein LWI29_011255 [Acer saccharum]